MTSSMRQRGRKAKRRQQRGDVGVPLVHVLHQQRPVLVRHAGELVFVERAVAQRPAIVARGRADDARQRGFLAGQAGEVLGLRSATRSPGRRCGSAVAASASSRAGSRPAACRAAACARHRLRSAAPRGRLASPTVFLLMSCDLVVAAAEELQQAPAVAERVGDGARCGPSRLRGSRLPGRAPAATARASAASRSSTTTSQWSGVQWRA